MKQQITFSEEEHRTLAHKLDKATKMLNSTARRYPDHHVAMYCHSVSQRPEQDGSTCTTIACMAGFYYLGKLTKPEFAKDENSNYSFLVTDDDKDVDFVEGAEMFADDLGFEKAVDLCHWAKQNPTIWGNNAGHGLFNHENAYGKATGTKLTINEIVLHLGSVSERLRDPCKRVAV